MADDVVVCVDRSQADAVAAKLNAGTRATATLADRAGQSGIFRPLSECITERYTEVVLIGTAHVVPIPDVSKRALLTAGERALIATRPEPVREAILDAKGATR